MTAFWRGGAKLAPSGPGRRTAPKTPKAGPLVQYALLAGPLLSMLDSPRPPGCWSAAALHACGLVLVGIAAAGALGALALPALRDTALEY